LEKYRGRSADWAAAFLQAEGLLVILHVAVDMIWRGMSEVLPLITRS
jgi:hypothetical protein